MKKLFAACAAFALLGVSVPAFACDGHGTAKADSDEATTTATAEEAARCDACGTDACSCDKSHDHKKATAKDADEAGKKAKTKA